VTTNAERESVATRPLAGFAGCFDRRYRLSYIAAGKRARARAWSENSSGGICSRAHSQRDLRRERKPFSTSRRKRRSAFR